MELTMLTLFVNGIPVLKLAELSEIPAPQGNESWQVIDEEGQAIASYQPKKSGKHLPSKRHATESAYGHLRAIAA